MNWKTEALERLARYDAMRQAKINLPEEIKRLEMEAYSLRGKSMETEPVKSCGSRPEDAMLTNLVYRQELAESLDQVERWLQVTNRALAALTPEEKIILHRLYMYPEQGSLNRLCGELQVEKSSIYRKRDAALQKFTYSLYGRTEN